MQCEHQRMSHGKSSNSPKRERPPESYWRWLTCFYPWLFEADFHEVPYLPENDRIRFTVSEEARRKMLDRLSQLNRERYEEEVAQGLHDKKKPTKGTRAAKSSKSARATAEPFAPPPQQTLFTMTPQMGLWEAPKQPSPAEGKGSNAGSDSLSRSAADLLAWLRKESDWRSRSRGFEHSSPRSATFRRRDSSACSPGHRSTTRTIGGPLAGGR
jgi:hypothetical protein